MTAVAKSDQSTGNSAFASYALQSGELVFAITAPYSRACRAANVVLCGVQMSASSRQCVF